MIRKAVSNVKNAVKGAYQIVRKKNCRERFKEVSGHDPMISGFCGKEMDLWKIWHPEYGVISDEYENLNAGKYDPVQAINTEREVKLPPDPSQMPLFET